MKILHIFTSASKMFVSSFTDAIKKEKWRDENEIVHLTKDNSKILKDKQFIDKLKHADKIILHALFSPQLLVLLFLNPKLTEKCYWIVWGGDLYSYFGELNSIKMKIIESLRRTIIPRFRGVGVLVEGDYTNLKKHYNFQGEKFSVMYPNGEQDAMISKILKENYEDKSGLEEKRIINIIVGNSATKSNEHIEVFERLASYDISKFRVYCPIAYGDLDYAFEVEKKGYEIFGENFYPIREFLEIEKYMRLLYYMDIAIYNCKRQQALGNIYAMIKFGKKVYLYENTSMWNEIVNKDMMKVYPIGEIGQNFDDFVRMDFDELSRNQDRGNKIYCVKEAIRRWKILLEG